jgi:hypothetical protein
MESGQTLTGTVGGIIKQIIEKANQIEDLFLRVGQISMTGIDRVEKITSGGLWEQATTIVKNTGMEIGFQPIIQSDGTLILEVNLQERLGEEVDWVLQDGQDGNIQITEVSVEGQIINRVRGSSSESAETSRIMTGILMDAESMATYRTRNRVQVYNGMTNQTQLEENTKKYLEANKAPILKITLNALDKGDNFRYLRIGNAMMLRGTRLILPGGERGWSGNVRISAMTYDESKNVVTMNVEGKL